MQRHIFIRIYGLERNRKHVGSGEVIVFMNIKMIAKQIKDYNFCEAYEELYANGYTFCFNHLTRDLPKLNSHYVFLMYAISRHEDVEKHLSICYYLYFMDPYIAGADSLIRWHLMQALKISPCDEKVLRDWIFGIYAGNPDSPFSEEELSYHSKF